MPLLTWYRQVRKANWASPAELKCDVGSASVLRDGRVVFNVAGNKYRVVVWINYPYRVVCALVEAWEARHFTMGLPDAVAAIRFGMDQRNLTAKDLVPCIGRPNRVYEFLNRKRPLTMGMAWGLHKGLRIPAELLLRTAG